MEDKSTPYAPPQSHIAAPPEQALAVIPASKWLRLVNFIIDYISYIFFSMLLGIVIALLFGKAGINYLQSIPRFFLGVPIVFTYYLVLEATLGRTLGKFVTGTKVVNGQGLKPSFSQILGRSLTRLIPLEGLTFLSRTRRGWHDRLPDTYVVRCR